MVMEGIIKSNICMSKLLFVLFVLHSASAFSILNTSRTSIVKVTNKPMKENYSMSNLLYRKETIKEESAIAEMHPCDSCDSCCYHKQCLAEELCRELTLSSWINKMIFLGIVVLVSLVFLYKVYYTSELPEQTNQDRIDEKTMEKLFAIYQNNIYTHTST
mmetsp:Transcript_19603/g.20401  ORF Transcript_19603/g.20401 Transcript_19603/m.20401 type:complete len:160 (+) Transcript_19603:44-523(+)